LPIPLTVDEIYRAHAVEVTRWAAQLGGPRLDLEDVVQEVFLLVQKNLGGYRGEAQLSTWLFRITENVVKQRRRRDHRWRWLRGSTDDAPDVASPEASPAQSLETRQARELLFRALDRMNERDRTAIILFEIEDLSGEEVAERMGMKLSTLWVVLKRARAELTRHVNALDKKGP
jgi:RNA polymerase sigma-70 factor (ECF subfamily)